MKGPRGEIHLTVAEWWAAWHREYARFDAYIKEKYG